LACDRDDGMMYWTVDNFYYDIGPSLFQFNPTNNALVKVGDIPYNFYYGISGLAIPGTNTNPPNPGGCNDYTPLVAAAINILYCQPITIPTLIPNRYIKETTSLSLRAE
jgi:hypothetical protein